MDENAKDSAAQDESLVMQAKKGDERAMNTLITKYQNFVFNLAYRHLNDFDEAKECSQEIFISLFKGIRSFQMRSSFKTWLYRVAVNRAIHEYHRRKKHSKVLYLREVRNPGKNEISDQKEYDIPDRSHVPYNEMEKKERFEILQKAIAGIKDIYKTPLILRDLEGMSYEDISEVLEIDIGTVKSRISRGRESLRSILFKKRDEYEST